MFFPGWRGTKKRRTTSHGPHANNCLTSNLYIMSLERVKHWCQQPSREQVGQLVIRCSKFVNMLKFNSQHNWGYLYDNESNAHMTSMNYEETSYGHDLDQLFKCLISCEKCKFQNICPIRHTPLMLWTRKLLQARRLNITILAPLSPQVIENEHLDWGHSKERVILWWNSSPS